MNKIEKMVKKIAGEYESDGKKIHDSILKSFINVDWIEERKKIEDELEKKFTEKEWQKYQEYVIEEGIEILMSDY